VRQSCSTAETVTIGLASHWPCITVLWFTTYGLMASGVRRADEQPTYSPLWGTALNPLHTTHVP